MFTKLFFLEIHFSELNNVIDNEWNFIQKPPEMPKITRGLQDAAINDDEGGNQFSRFTALAFRSSE